MCGLVRAAKAASEFWNLFHLLAGTHTFDAKEDSGVGGQKKRITYNMYVRTYSTYFNFHAILYSGTVLSVITYVCVCMLYYCTQSVQCVY